MTGPIPPDDELLADARGAANAVAMLAANEEAFRGVVEAFVAEDAEGVRKQLTAAGLLQDCHLICEWLRVKVCMLRCIRLCGDLAPPKSETLGIEQLRQLSLAVVKISADEGMTRRLTTAVEREDAQGFSELVRELEIGPLCIFLCHWVCSIRYQLFCEWVCNPLVVQPLDVVAEVRRAGSVLRRLTDDERSLASLLDAHSARDCEGLRILISRLKLDEGCQVICLWLCSWQCVRRCLILCGPPPKASQDVITEIREFAQLSQRIASAPDLFRGFLDALQKEDTDAFGELVGRLDAQRFCHQICLWLCHLVCHRFCVCVCPPITCHLTGPSGCTDEVLDEKIGGMSITVTGTAVGGGFSHYTLEWRLVEGHPCDDPAGWQSIGVVYPGGGATGTAAVVSGVLGWINSTALGPQAYEVRLCVFSTTAPGSPSCCCIQFSLFKHTIWISRVAIAPGAPVATPPGPFDPDADVVGPSGILVPVGGCVTIKGSAFVGQCNDRQIRCMDLRYGIGFLPGPGQAGFNPAAYTGSLLVPTGPVCYSDPDSLVEADKRGAWNWLISDRVLTVRWVLADLGMLGKHWKLQEFCFNSASQLPLGVMDLSGCPDGQHRCRSGKYTLLLRVDDTASNVYYDTQHVWFDNKPITAVFQGLEGLPTCSDMSLSQFAPANAPCAKTWPINLMGIAYDEYIDELDTSYPSDNFDYYSLSITRSGGPTLSVPITPDLAMFGVDPLIGTHRVGDPGVRCEPSPVVSGCPPPPAPPSLSVGQLSVLDLRVFDAVCAASIPSTEHYTLPAGFALNRGECCGYTFQLHVQDKTWSDGYAGGYHRATSAPYAVCICNDLPLEPR